MQAKIKFSKLLVTAAIFLAAGFGFSDSAKAGVIFEDDFSLAGGWSGGSTGGWGMSNLPTAINGQAWSAYKKPSNGTSDIVSGAGKGGNKPAWRLGYEIGAAQPQAISLAKHLTGDKDTGYDELYVRYVVKFDDNWKSGSDGQDQQTWKWLRLWQHRYPNTSSNWSECAISPDTGLSDTISMVMNLNGSLAEAFGITTTPGNNTYCGMTDPYVRFDWYDAPYTITATSGNFESMDWNGSRDWQIAKTGDTYPGTFKNTYPGGSQGWHTVEQHVKLSTIDAPGNGIFEVWLDGVKQTDSQSVTLQYNPGNYTALPTKNYNPNNVPGGGGINFLTFFDNMQVWSKYWNVASPTGWPVGQKFLYVDNIVVSTAPIGVNYVVDNGTSSDTTPPAAPTGLTVQ